MWLLALDYIDYVLFIFQGVFLFYIVKFEPVKYLTYEYPTWAHGIGAMMALSSVGLIPTYMIYLLIITPGTFVEVYTRFTFLQS